MDARGEIGRRIARARRRRGLSQAVLSGLVGRSESWLSQVERGQRAVDNHTVLNALADILGLPVDELTVKKTTAMTRYQAASAIRQAMMGYDGLSSLINPQHTQGPHESVCGGQTLIRRTLQAEAGDVVHETHQCSIVEARAIWAALLSGRAR